MNIVLLGKLLIGGVFTAGSSILLALNWDKITGSPYRDIVVYSKISNAEATNKVANTDINTEDKKQNYKCQYAKVASQTGKNDPFKCNIKQLKDPTGSKNQIDYEDFEKTFSDKKVLEKDKIFQISFQSNKYDWKNNGSEKIEVISTQEKDKKYGTADVWFVFDKDKAIKTTQFIGQSKATGTTGASLSNYKCSWKDESSSETCQVYVFSDTSSPNQESTTEYSALTFKNDTTETKEIKEHHHYRIVWTTTTEAKDNTNMTIFSKATKSDGTTMPEETIKFEKVRSSFLVGDKIVVIEDKPSS